MKLPSPSTKAAAVVTASISAALATIALRSFHRYPAATAGHSAADLPDLVGGVLASSADHRPPDHQPLGWGRRALVELDLEPPLPRVEELGNDVVGAGARFPALEGSTVMFLHIFKCAGSTLRRMLVDWAIAEGESGAIVVSCTNPKKEDKICLDDHELLDEPVQEEIMSRQKVLAGHFLWGFQRHVKGPHVMITSLRNPLEVFVSAKQFLHPDKMTKNLDQAREFVSDAMLDWLATNDPEIVHGRAGTSSGSGSGSGSSRNANTNTQEQRGGFIFRLTGDDKRTLHGGGLADAADEAMRNLEQFWVVGVVEQYAGFLEVLRRLLDPDKSQKKLWEKYSRKHLNSSPVHTRDILAAIDPELVHRFNGSLALQWKVYEKAVSLWDVRCREVLPHKKHRTMCAVDPPPSTYR